MPRRKKNAKKWQYAGLALLAVLTVGVVASTLQPAPAPPVASFSPKQTPVTTPTTAAPAKLVLSPGSKALFFGDSWTAGYAATPSTQGFAYLTGAALGLDFTVNTEGSGTGYLNVGPAKKGTYNTRLAAMPADPDLRLLVLQGGLNDQGQGLSGFVEAARTTLTTAKTKFPNAQIVIMGPISPAATTGPDLMSIDASLRGLAEANSLNYVSGQYGHWITAENLGQVIDESKGRHPSTAGHAYLADKLTQALKALAG